MYVTTIEMRGESAGRVVEHAVFECEIIPPNPQPPPNTESFLMDIIIDPYSSILTLNAFKLNDNAPSTPQQQPKSGLRKWLRRRSSTQPPSPEQPSSSRRRNKAADYGAPEAGSTPSQSSLLRSNVTDAIVTTQDAASHQGVAADDADDPDNVDIGKQAPKQDDSPSPTPKPPPAEITPEEVTVTASSSGGGHASIKGRVLHVLAKPRRSTGQASSIPDDDAFSTQQSLASSSQVSGQRASLTAQLARGELPDEVLQQSVLDGSHHCGALLLGRASTSSRSTTSQQVGAAAYVGLWRKNMEESDTGGEVEELLDMPRLQRMVRQRTMVLEIQDTGDALQFVWHVRLNGGKEILKTEAYPRDGGPVEGPRRDGREGCQRATAGMSKGYLQVKGVQDDPYGAMFQDRYVLSTHGNRMRVEHKMQMRSGGKGPVRYTSVWHRVRDEDAHV